MDNFKRICMWSGPRNISTTMMYSFAQRKDTKVFDEPLYAHYLKNSDAEGYHPGAKEILLKHENSGEKVIEQMLSNQEAPVQFYKQMTHHLLELDRSFMKSVHHILLTRDPKEMLPSFAAVIDDPTLADTGYLDHVKLIEYFTSNHIPFTVLDSKKVLLNPKEQLEKLCTTLDISFLSAMLEWQKGARQEDGVWAKYWYKNIHNSTGFKPYSSKKETFPEYLRPLLNECTPYYKRLSKLAL